MVNNTAPTDSCHLATNHPHQPAAEFVQKPVLEYSELLAAHRPAKTLEASAIKSKQRSCGDERLQHPSRCDLNPVPHRVQRESVLRSLLAAADSKCTQRVVAESFFRVKLIRSGVGGALVFSCAARWPPHGPRRRNGGWPSGRFT